MRPTAIQEMTLRDIETGMVMDGGCHPLLIVASFQWSRDGEAIVAHRTVLAADTGNPRTDYRTELYRIQREGSVARL